MQRKGAKKKDDDCQINAAFYIQNIKDINWSRMHVFDFVFDPKMWAIFKYLKAAVLVHMNMYETRSELNWPIHGRFC